VASHKRLFTYYQRDTGDNHKYYQEFCAHVETLETYGGIGAVGVTPTFLAAKLNDLALEKVIQDADNPTDAERLIAIKQCCDEFLGCLMLSGANRDQYADLKSDPNNQYGFGKDLYPKSPDGCLSLLIADRMHLSDNLARIFQLLIKSNMKTKHLYLLMESLTRKLR